jgi:hypothetical protein
MEPHGFRRSTVEMKEAGRNTGRSETREKRKGDPGIPVTPAFSSLGRESHEIE